MAFSNGDSVVWIKTLSGAKSVGASKGGNTKIEIDDRREAHAEQKSKLAQRRTCFTSVASNQRRIPGNLYTVVKVVRSIHMD